MFGAPVPLEKEKAKIKEVKDIRDKQTGADTYTYRYSHGGTLLACTDAVNGKTLSGHPIEPEWEDYRKGKNMSWFKELLTGVKKIEGTGDFHFKTNKERETEMYEIMQEKMPSHGFVQGKKKETWYRFDGQYLFCIRICMRYGEATLQYSVVSLCSSFEFLKMPSKDFYEGLSYKKTQHVNAQLQYSSSHSNWHYMESKADPGVSFPIEYVRSWTAAEDVVALLDHMVLPFFATFRGGPTVLQCALSGGRDPSIYTRFASADLDGKKHMMVQLLALQPDLCPPVAQLFYAFGEDDALRLYYEYCKAQEVMLVPEKKAASVEEGEKKADTFPREAVDEAVKYGFETGDFSRMDALLDQIQKQNFALLRKCVPALFEGKEATYTPLRRQAPLPPAWAEGKAKSPQQGPCRESVSHAYKLVNLHLRAMLEQEGFRMVNNVSGASSFYRREGDKVFAIHFPVAGLQSVCYNVLYLYEGHRLILKGKTTEEYLENCLYADWRYEALPWGEDYTFPYLESLDLCESYALKRYVGQLQEVVLPFFRHFRGEQDLLTAWEAEFAQMATDLGKNAQPLLDQNRNEKVNPSLLFSCYRMGKEEWWRPAVNEPVLRYRHEVAKVRDSSYGDGYARTWKEKAESECTQLFWRYEQSGDPAEIEAKMADNIAQGRAALAQWLG